jgi:hypothetical protein
MSLNYSPRIVTDGLVLYLDAANTKSYFGSGASWNDLSRSRINSDLINGPTFNNDNGGSIVFDGTNDYATIPFNSVFNVTTSPFTVIVWNRKNDTNNSYNGLITADDTADDNWKIFKDDGQDYYKTRVGSTVLSFPSYTINKWHQYAFTKSGSILINYFDGIYCNQTNDSSNPNSFLNNIALGSYRLSNAIDGQYLMYQSFSQILFYTRTLSSTEILQNYNSIKGRYGL